MADEVKLITFAGETVSPLYDGLMQELYTGGGGIITGAVVTIKDASTLHITGGYGALCGREFEIFASDIPVTLSSSGTLKGRLYLHMDLAQSGAPIELLVEVASSLTPVVQDSDVNTTNGVYEVNLATFDVGTSAISNLVDVAPKAVKIPDALSSLNSALANVDSKIDNTLVQFATVNFTPANNGARAKYLKNGNVLHIWICGYLNSSLAAGSEIGIVANLSTKWGFTPLMENVGLATNAMNCSTAGKIGRFIYSPASDALIIRNDSTSAFSTNEVLMGYLAIPMRSTT